VLEKGVQLRDHLVGKVELRRGSKGDPLPGVDRKQIKEKGDGFLFGDRRIW
jgi:hypothetical protein